MESVETTKTEQSEEVRKAERELADQVRRQVRHYTLRFRHNVIKALAGELQPSIEAADKLVAMERQIRQIFDGLDAKAKAAITVLQKLSILESEGVGVSYGNQIENEFLIRPEYVKQALKEHPHDKDLICLNDAYDLANFVLEVEDKAEHVEAPTQAAEPTEIPASPEKQDEGSTTTVGLIENQVKQWLLNRSLETKVACVLMDNYCLDDHNTKDLWEAVNNKYDETVVRIAQNPGKYPADLVFFAGICAEADIWRSRY